MFTILAAHNNIPDRCFTEVYGSRCCRPWICHARRTSVLEILAESRLQVALRPRCALSPRQTAHRSIFVIGWSPYIYQPSPQFRATMAPIPSTTQALTARLNILSESNKAINQLIQRLAKLDFQPGSQPLDATDEGDVRLELSAEIHESLKGLEEELEFLRQEVEDVTLQGALGGRRRNSTKDNERSRLAVLLARLTEDLRL